MFFHKNEKTRLLGAGIIHVLSRPAYILAHAARAAYEKDVNARE
jgi:hypothetical protein